MLYLIFENVIIYIIKYVSIFDTTLHKHRNDNYIDNVNKDNILCYT